MPYTAKHGKAHRSSVASAALRRLRDKRTNKGRRDKLSLFERRQLADDQPDLDSPVELLAEADELVERLVAKVDLKKPAGSSRGIAAPRTAAAKAPIAKAPAAKTPATKAPAKPVKPAKAAPEPEIDEDDSAANYSALAEDDIDRAVLAIEAATPSARTKDTDTAADDTAADDTAADEPGPVTVDEDDDTDTPDPVAVIVEPLTEPKAKAKSLAKKKPGQPRPRHEIESVLTEEVQREVDALLATALPSDLPSPETFAQPTFMTITPTLAAHFLNHRAPQQRPILRRHWLFLARQLDNDIWQYNGDTLKVNEAGQMLDGQHRCLAAVHSGKSFPTVLVTVPDKSFATIDTGSRVRGAGDVFRAMGEHHYNRLAACLTMLMDLDEGFPIFATGGSNRRRSPADLQIAFVKHEGIRRSVEVTGTAGRAISASSIWPTLHYLMAKLDQTAADIFFEDLVYGAGLERTDPVYHLRERLLTNTAAKVRATKREQVAWFINAWNGRRRNQPMRALRGVTADKDPELE